MLCKQETLRVYAQAYTEEMNSYAGTFESHITVNAESYTQVERFRQLCAEMELKSIVIELARGVSRTQPMTATHHQGSLESVLAEVQSIAQAFERHGFNVARVKLEADPDNNGVPHTDAEASLLPATNYFEFHVLVILTGLSELSALGELCAQHDVHLSSNAFKRLPEGKAQRFVTMRLYGVGRNRAAALFERLSSDLEKAGYRIARAVREYVVYDTNLLLDAGWMDSPETSADER